MLRFDILNKLFLVILMSLLIACTPSANEDPVTLSEKFAPPQSTPKPEGTNAALGLAGYAKVMCSAVFISGRDIKEAIVNSGYFFLPDSLQDKAIYQVDTINKIVTLMLGDSLARSAKYWGDQGCIIQTEKGLSFTPIAVTTSLPDPSTMSWPMGDKVEDKNNHPNQAIIEEAMEAAFSPAEALTAAFIVVHNGKIVGERYAPGITKDTQLESWSMGKSLTATLIGRMIQQGYFKLEDPAPVTAWQTEGDPRSDIKIKDLLQMSSGLKFQSHRDPNARPELNLMDHFYIYSGAVDAFNYSFSRPLQFPIGSEGRYHNCDPLILGHVMKKTLLREGKEYLTYPQEELFDKIGIRKQIMETDPYGNFLLTGFDYGTARNWARLGLLYHQDGLWNGEQILPEGFSQFVSTLAPGWKTPVYG
ncbi:MAG: beta-lactamase family protein, partial [Cyclobacteriaceae bacterium]|nr:beta-lactamase family protein [Cyclobacteriaceae bacterium]